MVAMAGLSAAGTAPDAAGQIGQADTYSRLADIDTEVQQQQAAFAEEEGELIRAQSYEQAKEVRTAGHRQQAEQRAIVGGSGIKVDTGSPFLLAMESARNVELDALTTEYQGQQAKTIAARQAGEARRQAALTQYDKRLQKRAASQQAAGTVLSGAMNILSKGVGGLGPSMAGSGGGGGSK